MKEYQNEAWLRQKYEVERLSTVDIAKLIGCGRATLQKYMDQFGITRRDPITAGNMKSKRYDYNESFFSKIDSEEKAYILGFISADGSISDTGRGNNKRLIIGVASSDRDILESICRILGIPTKIIYDSVVKDTRHPDKTYNRSMITINSTRMCRDLINLGIQPRKTGNEIYPQIPKELNRHFIRGVVDGDGGIYYSLRETTGKDHFTPIIGITTGRDLLEGISSVIYQELQIDKPIVYDKPGTNLIRYMDHDKVRRILQYLYDDSRIHLNRKKKTSQEILGLIEQYFG